MFVRLALGLFLSLAALPAVPHSENEGGPGYAVIDCEHPAANVATTLPEGIASLACQVRRLHLPAVPCIVIVWFLIVPRWSQVPVAEQLVTPDA